MFSACISLIYSTPLVNAQMPFPLTRTSCKYQTTWCNPCKTLYMINWKIAGLAATLNGYLHTPMVQSITCVKRFKASFNTVRLHAWVKLNLVEFPSIYCIKTFFGSWNRMLWDLTNTSIAISIDADTSDN